MSYGIRIPDASQAAVARADFPAAAQAVVDGFHAYDGGPLETLVRAQMAAGVAAAETLLADPTLIQGESFEVVISGHCTQGDTLDWQKIEILARS